MQLDEAVAAQLATLERYALVYTVERVRKLESHHLLAEEEEGA